MYEHHRFSPSVLEDCPRPTEQEIRIKAPALLHNGRAHRNGGNAHG